MIRIYKNNDIKVVTKGAFENFFKPLGYNIIIDAVSEEKKSIESNEKNINKNLNKPASKKNESSNKKSKSEQVKEGDS